MTAASRSGAGRPAASSHGTLEEAACELAFELGWEAVSADAIARRAGVSRSSFFNYYSSKADVLWRNVDEALADVSTLRQFVAALEQSGPPIALTHIDVMGARQAAIDSAPARVGLLTSMIIDAPADDLLAFAVAAPVEIRASVRRIRAAALAAGVMAAIMEWASAGIGRRPLLDYLETAFGETVS